MVGRAVMLVSASVSSLMALGLLRGYILHMEKKITSLEDEIKNKDQSIREVEDEAEARIAIKRGQRKYFSNRAVMEEGRAPVPRKALALYDNRGATKVTRVALTGGPCAGKSSALKHLVENATANGFDVLTAPEIATLYFNSSYTVRGPSIFPAAWIYLFIWACRLGSFLVSRPDGRQLYREGVCFSEEYH